MRWRCTRHPPAHTTPVTRALVLVRAQGRGTVVTGRVEQGIVRTGDEVEIVGIRPSAKSTVTGGCGGRGWVRGQGLGVGVAWGTRPRGGAVGKVC